MVTEPNTDQPDPLEGAGPRPPRLLIVDDDAPVRMLLRHPLTDCGHEIGAAISRSSRPELGRAFVRALHGRAYHAASPATVTASG